MPNEFTVVVERDDEWFIAFYPDLGSPWADVYKRIAAKQ